MDAALTRRSLLGGAALAALTACSPNAGERTIGADGTLVALDDLGVGDSTRVTDGDTTVIVTRTGETTAVAFDAACTHQGCPVKPRDGVLACPCHGSRFDPRTGAVENGPAKAPLATYPVRVEGGKVVKA